MPTQQIFYGSSSVTVSGDTNTLPPVSVTASGSGTSTSAISQLDADNLAIKVATNVANAALQNDINVINQTTKIVYIPPLVPYYRQLEIDVIVDEMKAYNDANGYPNNFLYSNSIYRSYRNIPYLELQYVDSTSKNLIVYSTTYFNKVTYLYSVLGTDLVLDSANVIINGSRVYVWDETIVNNIQVPTVEFPLEKTFQFKPTYQTPQNTTTQIMKKVASVPIGAVPSYYTTTKVLRETIYTYYASTIIFLLIDSNDTTNSTTNMPYTSKPKIYAMQTMSNLFFKDLNIDNLYLLKNKLQLPAGTQPPDSKNINYIPLPPGFNFVVYTIPYNSCVYSVSTLNENAILIADACNNSYQYIDPKYNKFLYDQFNI